MQWFRMWVDAIDDEKLKLLAFEDRWHYVAILCMKRKGMLDVKEPEALRDRKVGVKLGLGDRERDEVRRRLIDVDLIDEQWQPKGWDKRQYVSDADPTALERKHRQRLKQRHGRVTRDKSVSHGSITDESRPGHTAQSQITDTDTDTEKKKTKRARKRALVDSIPPEPPPGLDFTAWSTWVEYRRKSGKAIKDFSTAAAQRELVAFGANQAQVVQHSIAHGYQGLFAPKNLPAPGKVSLNADGSVMMFGGKPVEWQ